MKVTEIKSEIGPVRRLMLVQSFGQLISFVLYFSLTSAAMIFLMRILLGTLQIGPVMLIPALVVASFSLRTALPESFVVTGGKPETLDAVLRDRLRFFGYRRDDEKSKIVYVSKLPAWISWKENSVRIESVEGGAKIVSPRIISRRLYEFLESL
jgi:hypothetical protein